MEINELLLNAGIDITTKMAELKKKNVKVPSWAKLEKEYNPKMHPVMDKALYPDKVRKGKVEKMTRITRGWQKLATKRMAELAFGIPAKRICKPQNEQEQKVISIIEDIYQKNRINSINIDRAKKLYCACEICTIWYAQESQTEYAGEISQLKLRCKTYSPKDGAQIFPYFNEYDDLTALSVAYARTENGINVSYFEVYTDSLHIRYVSRGEGWQEEINEQIAIGKIAGVYAHREEPIWEDESENVYEAEWALSRNGNYLRKNARPNWVVFADEKITAGKDIMKDNDGVGFLQYPSNAKAGYETWQQATDSLKYHYETIKQNFFMQLQLPDISYENMKSAPMSGESRKMMFIDAQMKVTEESGMWVEFLDRELNVIKAFMRFMYPSLAGAIDSISIETEITPYMISDDAEKITNLTNATGGKAIMSQRTAIANLGWVDDIDEELSSIADESTADIMQQPMM